MPLTAIEAGVVDHQVAAGEVGSLLMRLADRTFEDLGSPSGYTCPDCNGSLIDVSEGNYRCHVGNAWTADALLEARDGEVDGALWVAMRSLQEKAKLSRRLAAQVDAGILRDRYRAIADETEHAMSVLGSRLSDFVIQHEEFGD
jgi:two-component system chemotaxis response regulator CheB